MQNKQQKGPKEFYRLMGEYTRKAFVNAVGGEEDLADVALRLYAQENIVEEEHDKIKEVQSNDPEKFMRMVSNMVLSDPDNYRDFLDSTKTVYREYRRLRKERESGGSPERK
jgi:hypothetical protein